LTADLVFVVGLVDGWMNGFTDGKLDGGNSWFMGLLIAVNKYLKNCSKKNLEKIIKI
jgi:hypothetical protein